ncbi:MAG TPA: hypothetical protein ENI80_11900 [Acidiferrobacteraceae bacterium]|nr:hypothetical protein [Acidiferrobacteraceae bacterium]
MYKTISAVVLISILGGYWAYSQSADQKEVPNIKPPSAQIRLEQLNPELLVSRYVLDVSVHSQADLEALLDRVEYLHKKNKLPRDGPAFTLVLHGPEIDFFAKKNYPKHKSIVDRVADLDTRGIIETKMCQTMMRFRSIRDSDVPPFIELVPYGPDEVDRLIKAGRVRM